MNAAADDDYDDEFEHKRNRPGSAQVPHNVTFDLLVMSNPAFRVRANGSCRASRGKS
jgi:hypothetical protein